MKRSRILGTGHYVPPRVVTNQDIMQIMETSNEFIVQRTGVERRRHAEPEFAASDLAAIACRKAVEDAGLAMERDRPGDHEHDHARPRRSRAARSSCSRSWAWPVFRCWTSGSSARGCSTG